jgi:transposase
LVVGSGLVYGPQPARANTVRIQKVVRKLLGVEEILVKDISFDDKLGLVLDVKPRWQKGRCGKCNKKGCPGYDTPRRLTEDGDYVQRPRWWRHLSLGRVSIWLRYTLRRVECPVHGVVTEAVPWANHESRFTKEFEELTAYLAQQMDKTAVCTLMGINWRTVGTIIERIVKTRLDPKRLENLYVIGIDEISFRRQHEYVTVVVDHAKHRVVWTGKGKSADTLKHFFAELGEERSKQITNATLDMSAAFISAVRECAPQATLNFDRFHVQKLANEALDEVRRAEVREADGEAASFIKKSRWALLKNPWNLTRKQGQKLREIQQNNQRLYRGYLLKESLAKVLDYRQPGRAATALDEWLAWARRSQLAPFVKLAGTIAKHADGILSYVKTRLTNGVVEGLNNHIRLITRRAFGFHSAGALESMIQLCCGGIVLNPPLPTPTSST